MSSQHPPTTALAIVRDEQRRNAHDPAIVSLLERIANRIENETATDSANPLEPGTSIEVLAHTVRHLRVTADDPELAARIESEWNRFQNRYNQWLHRCLVNGDALGDRDS